MTRREIAPQSKMEKVVKTARGLFVRRGFHNVSIPQIVAASGVSTGAIYHHFHNKEGVARSVHRMTLLQIQEAIAARLAQAGTVRDQLEAFAEVIFEVTESDPEMMTYMLFIQHDHFLPDTLPICSTESFCRVQEIIERGMATDLLKPGDVLLAATSFTGVLLRAVELRLRGVIKTPLQRLQPELFANAWRTICR